MQLKLQVKKLSPAVAMYPNTTNGAEAGQVELSNGPEIKTLDFDKDSDENAQFAVAFPKSRNEGTVTFQAFFTADSTNTGTASWDLAGVAIADNNAVTMLLEQRLHRQQKHTVVQQMI